jgi:hypothetical protein
MRAIIIAIGDRGIPSRDGGCSGDKRTASTPQRRAAPIVADHGDCRTVGGAHLILQLIAICGGCINV